MLRLPDHWVWDSWLAVDDEGLYHLFFLRASRALHKPERRHLRAAIGHAVSTDLRAWELLPDALVHADAPAWDDCATWTGSVVRGTDGHWYLFYTGVTRAGRASVQRVGVAVSADLLTWHRVGAWPLVQADPRWYECLDGQSGVSESWRDPFVFPDPGGDGWHMVITARARTGPTQWRGVVGHARSHDLLQWEVRPPLSEPAGFGELEVPHVQVLDGRALLVFSCLPEGMAATRRQDLPPGATWAVLGGSVAEGWDLSAAVPFAHPSLFAGRLVRDPNGDWCLLGFRHTEDGVFHGEILDPIPVTWANGRLVDRPVSEDPDAGAARFPPPLPV